jgi:hypothetical protein
MQKLHRHHRFKAATWLWLPLLIGLICVAAPDVSAAQGVGRVTAAVNQAQVGGAAASVGTPVGMGAELRTGAKSRLQITFRDNTTLMLGENARVVVDRYVFDPQASRGEVALRATRGAFRFAGGKLKDMQRKKIIVNTPSAALAVRGTEFWAGPIDGRYGVLLLHGKLQVSSRSGKARR